MHALQALLQSEYSCFVVATRATQQQHQKQSVDHANANCHPNFHHTATVFKGVSDLPCVK